MIVPRPRLIVITALVLLPVGGVAAWSAETIATGWCVAAGLCFFCGLDSIRGGRRFNGFRVSVAPIIRLTVDRAGAIVVTVYPPSPAAGALRIGLAFPAGVETDSKELTLSLETSPSSYSLTWPCRAVRRGRYPLSDCYMELPSPWGLWAIRRRFSLQSEIRAYPNLISGRQDLGGLFRRREWGLRTRRRIGKGREFEQLRDYCPGDSYEDIDWKATARRRYPVTRVYQVEQSQELYVVLDASRLSTRRAAVSLDRRRREPNGADASQSSIFDRFITAALVLGVAANQAADRYGVLIFSDKPDCFIKAGRGRTHFNACRDALYHRMPDLVSPDFDELFAFVGTRLRKRALLVFLTSLDDPVLAENMIQAMPAAAKKHIIMVNMLRPAGAYPLFSSDNVQEITGVYQHLAGHMIWNNLTETRRKLRRHQVQFQLLNNEALCGQLVQQYMDVKQRQIL